MAVKPGLDGRGDKSKATATTNAKGAKFNAKYAKMVGDTAGMETASYWGLLVLRLKEGEDDSDR
jgi:hypothetical protein